VIEQIEERTNMEKELHRRGLLGIARECAHAHCVKLEEMFSERRYGPIVHARHLMCAVLRARGMSYPSIGRVMLLDHTTVMQAVKKVTEDDVLSIERSIDRTSFAEAIMMTRY